MAHSSFRRSLLVGMVLCSAPASDLTAQTADDLFATDALQEIRLFISSRDLQQLRAHYDENTYYPADLQWKDLRLRNIAVRSRGSASRNPWKPGLQIDFDRFVSDQELVGLRSLVLDNLWQDPSMIRERLAMAFFERMGEPAPRESFSRLYINNAYQGLYGIVEDVSPDFLARTFDKDTGYLFEYKNVRPFYGEYLGDDLEAYKPLFEPRSHKLEADTILYSPIRDLFREINHDDDGVWRERVEEYLNLRQFVTHVAIEMFLAEPDGVLGFSGMNNFYLLRQADTKRHRLIPWDKDLSFSDITSPILHQEEENELFRRAMAYDDLRTLYLKKIKQCAYAASAGGWLQKQIVATASLISEAAREDTFKPVSNEEFDAALKFMKRFARQRSDFVVKELQSHPEWSIR
jgi:spore coat protein CotH